MSTRKEFTRQAVKEFRLLHDTWIELFIDAANEGEKLAIDAVHQPPSIKKFLQEVIDQMTDRISDALAEGEDVEQIFQAAMDVMGRMAVLVGVRMYQMGTHLANTLPYDKLTPCPCLVVPDDDLVAFTSDAIVKGNPTSSLIFDVTGDGFIIKGRNSV